VRLSKKLVGRSAAIIAAGGLLATVGLGSATSIASSPFGTPHPATKSPYVLAMIDLIGGPVSFPQAEQGAQAAIDYVNQYEDGIKGHKIVLKECSNATLAAPASATCANELVADNPLLVLGAADTGAAGAFPIWQAHNLAYVGGSPFTPVESNAKNAAIFTGFSGPDNFATIAYAAHTLHIKSVSIIEANDTQGISVGEAVGVAAKADGMTDTLVPLPDTASTSDFAAAAAQAESSNPGLIFVEEPSECPQTLIALQQTGYKGKLAGIGPCASPPAIKAAGTAASGFFYAQPNVAFDQIHTKAWGKEIALTEAILAKYAPANIAVDSNALAPFGAIMNLHTTLDAIKGKLDEASILGALRKGSNHPNWLAHSYTCNGKQDPSQTAVCDAYQQILQVKNGNVVTLSTKWVNGG
jgi:branched-chain amino acid transport system substrate-binding protein